MKTFKQFMKEGGFVHRIKDLKTLSDKDIRNGIFFKLNSKTILCIWLNII